jgi:predicted DsbA family dithiol-disulfide isomerase
MTITIDVISDVICPWCYVGKRRMEKAIAARRGHDVRVRWHPFQLNPHMPKEGKPRKEYRTAKFGSWEQSLKLDAQVAEAGQAEGIEFAFDRIERTPNTLDAHRLIWLADKEGLQDPVVEALFRAYFTEGWDISNPQLLLDVVAGAGLDRDRAEALMGSDDGVATIRAEEDQAHRNGVQGVPFYVVNNKAVLSGAVGPSAFLDAFDRVGDEPPLSEPSVCKVGAGGEPSC